MCDGSARGGGLKADGEIKKAVDSGHRDERAKVGFSGAAVSDIVVVPVEDIFGGCGEGDLFDGPIFGGSPEVSCGEVEDKVRFDLRPTLYGNLAVFGLIEARVLTS